MSILFEAETEAYVAVDMWGGVVVPCDIVDIFDVTGKAVSGDTIDAGVNALVRIFVGSSEELFIKQMKFEFIVPITNLKIAAV